MSDSTNQTPILTNRLYDALKYIAQILLPAVGALYFGLAQIWGFPAGGEVVGSITVLDTFLGVLLHLSNTQYNNSDARYDGEINVVETKDKKTFNLNLNDDPANFEDKDSLTFKVNKTP